MVKGQQQQLLQSTLFIYHQLDYTEEFLSDLIRQLRYINPSMQLQ